MGFCLVISPNFPSFFFFFTGLVVDKEILFQSEKSRSFATPTFIYRPKYYVTKRTTC